MVSRRGQPRRAVGGWYERIYDKVIGAGKSLYVFVEDGDAQTQIDGINKLVRRYGSERLLVRFLADVSEENARMILRAFPD